MHLLDCFIELIAYIAYFTKIVSSEQPEYNQIKADIDQLINKSQKKLHQGRFSQNEFDLAQFAVFAWIDETILGSSWQGKSRWQGEQLQRLYYQTVDAGELFFDKLNTLQPGQVGVREVYYLCLALGFSGRFCNPGDNILLEQLKFANLKLITDTPIEISSLKKNSLFAEAYQAEGSLKHIESTSGRRFPIEIITGIGAPVVLYGVLFLIYRFILDSVGHNFISMVP
jgi:type VI secretion system protein ImpK